MAIGTIKKLALVPSMDPALAGGAPSEGYGIIVGEDGRKVFFLDSVVNEVPFCELKRGLRVRYTLEEGPLSRAVSVVPCHGGWPANCDNNRAAQPGPVNETRSINDQAGQSTSNPPQKTPMQ